MWKASVECQGAQGAGEVDQVQYMSDVKKMLEFDLSQICTFHFEVILTFLPFVQTLHRVFKSVLQPNHPFSLSSLSVTTFVYHRHHNQCSEAWHQPQGFLKRGRNLEQASRK
jgi:hypothetical protein